MTTSYDDFVANLKAAGVLERVEIKRVYSHELAREWKDSIRFLWIDGDHTYEGAKADLDMFRPYLVHGAVVAMHDVLGTFAVVADPADVGAQVRERFGDVIDRFSVYASYPAPLDLWDPLVADLG